MWTVKKAQVTCPTRLCASIRHAGPLVKMWGSDDRSAKSLNFELVGGAWRPKQKNNKRRWRDRAAEIQLRRPAE